MLRPWFYCQGRNRVPLKALEIKGVAKFDVFLSMTVKSVLDVCENISRQRDTA